MIFPEPLRLPPERSPHKFVIVSYNVHGCKGMDGLINPERVARVIQEMDAQIIGLHAEK